MRCWPPSSSSPSASVHSLVHRVLGKGGPKLGWESWPKAPVSGGIGGGPRILSGLSLQVSWVRAAASWGQRVQAVLWGAGHRASLLEGPSPSSVGLSQQKVQGRIGEKLRNPERQSWFSQVHPLEFGSSRGCPGHASACSFLNCSSRREERKNSLLPLQTPCMESPVFLIAGPIIIPCGRFCISHNQSSPSCLCPVSSASLVNPDNDKSCVLSRVRGTGCLVLGLRYSPEPPFFGGGRPWAGREPGT